MRLSLRISKRALKLSVLVCVAIKCHKRAKKVKNRLECEGDKIQSFSMQKIKNKIQCFKSG